MKVAGLMRTLLLIAAIFAVYGPAAAQSPAGASPQQGWAPGHYQDGRWIPGPVAGRYDNDGGWIAGDPAGRVGPGGVWQADPAPGYWDDQGRWRAGAVMGEYGEQGRWRTTAPGVDLAAPQPLDAPPHKGSGMARPRPSR